MPLAYKLGNWEERSQGRALVRAKLANGRDAGGVLISEDVAQPWPNKGNRWCSR